MSLRVTKEIRFYGNHEPPRGGVEKFISGSFPGWWNKYVYSESYITGVSIHSVDSNRDRILRPSDWKVGFDEFDIRTGEHVRNFVLDDESWSTYAAVYVGDSVILGGNGKLVIVDPDNQVRVFEGDQLSSFHRSHDQISACSYSVLPGLGSGYRIFQWKGNQVEVYRFNVEGKPTISPNYSQNRKMFVGKFYESSAPTPVKSLTVGRFDDPNFIGEFEIECNDAVHASYTARGDRILICSLRSMSLHSASDGKVIRRIDYNCDTTKIDHHVFWFHLCVHSPCGRYFAVVNSSNRAVDVFLVDSLERIFHFDLHGDCTHFFRWSSKGNAFCIGVAELSGGGGVKVFDVRRGGQMSFVDAVTSRLPGLSGYNQLEYLPKAVTTVAGTDDFLFLGKDKMLRRYELT